MARTASELNEGFFDFVDLHSFSTDRAFRIREREELVFF
jgi:hypothetical protein